jgi:hypothetical protein
MICPPWAYSPGFDRQVARNNLAEIQQGIEYFNALARSPDAIRLEIKIVDIGASFALVPT